MKLKYIIPLFAFIPVQAQVNIDFESETGYKSLGVYDVWEESPFRTNALTGNWAVTPNPDTSVNEIIEVAPNPSEKVLGAQRSRFGSNRFGVRIDLEEPFALSPELQYVHVMLHKPKSGRVMLVGLGSRNERNDQNPYTEQFWQPSSNNAEVGQWSDMVFPIKGWKGITIRSLVLVPDLESPHNLTEDFLFYIDDIVVNNSPNPRVIYEYYRISCGSKTTAQLTRTDRYSTGISLTCGNDVQSLPMGQQTNKMLYQDLTSSTFYVQPGQSLTPAIGFNKDWMHAYCYIDFNNDGKFSTGINDDGTPSAGSELVSYNAYSPTGTDYKNSLGQSVSDNPGSNGLSGKMPAFTLPADLKPGRYRMRFKLDWDNIDPRGNPGDETGQNSIVANGGVIADVMLNVAGSTVEVNDYQLNGEIISATDNKKLTPYNAPYGKTFTIKAIPADGFYHDGIDVKVGFNLDGDKTDEFGNPQYEEFYVPGFKFSEDGLYTFPANKMRGNMLINGRMIDVNNTEYTPTEPYALNFPKDLQINRDDRHLDKITLASSASSDRNLVIEIADKKDTYQNFLSNTFNVCQGATVTPTVNYTGNAMHTYWYVDLDEDGTFDNTLNTDGTPAAELLSYSHYAGKNSLGESVASSLKPEVNHPFTIGAATTPGLYRARFKIDWNNIDPAGHYSPDGNNKINENGGYVLDFMINVHPANVEVNTEAIPDKYGALTNEHGTAIGATAPFGTALNISSVTSTGFTVKSLNVKYGYHTEWTSPTVMGHTYWHETDLTEANGLYTIPADIMAYPIILSGEFETSGIHEIIASDSPIEAYDLQGRRINKPTKGLYIVNSRKVHIK